MNLTETPKIAAKREGTRVILPCRLSYVHLDAPWSAAEGNEKKYQLVCIVDKTDQATVKLLSEAMKTAIEEGITKCWKGRKPAGIEAPDKLPVRDGDTYKADDEAFSGKLFFNAKSKSAVAVLGLDQQPIEVSNVYSGCYALVSVNFFPYSSGGGNGIAAGLNAVLKLGDGERLGGSGDGSKDFVGIDLSSMMPSSSALLDL